MRIIRDVSSCPADAKGAVVALGNFDGVHLGHQAILGKTIEIAKAGGMIPAAMTFEPHPREFFSRDKQDLRIYPFRRKVELLESLGIKTLFVARFNQTLASMSAGEFVTRILQEKLAAKHIVTGYNFAFGRGRSGDTQFLGECAKKQNFSYTACPPVCASDNKAVSSTTIREVLAKGDVRKAAQLLGHRYQVVGYVRHGEQRGRMLGFPTANLSMDGLFKPRFGVYAVRMQVDGKWHNGVANLGIKPTFGRVEPLLEAHGFDMNADLYGKFLRVELADFIREEKRFDGVEALKTQIAQDALKARELLHEN